MSFELKVYDATLIHPTLAYQGEKTIPHYASYIHSLLRLQVPFKVGVVERADWNVAYEQLLEKSSYFRGMVVFLLPVK